MHQMWGQKNVRRRDIQKYQEFLGHYPVSRWFVEVGSWPEPCISDQIFLYIFFVLFWVNLETIEMKKVVILL